MVNGALSMLAGAGEFGLELGDARLQLGHRKRVEILTSQQRERVIGRGRKIVFDVHIHNVDRAGARVNKPPPSKPNRVDP